MCNNKVIVSSKLKKIILDKSHAGDFKSDKIKHMAKTVYWWPDKNSDIEKADSHIYCDGNDITPKFTAPYHPSTNGHAERFVETYKVGFKKIKDSAETYDNIYKALQKIIHHYRITIHASTYETLAEKMFSRKKRLD